MEKKKFKLGLLPKLLIAIVLGIIIGQFFPVWFCRVVVTASSIFSSFLKFIIPLMIVAYVTMGIADLKSGAGKLLLITVALAYGSTLIAGSASYLVSANLFPSFMSEGALEQIAATADNSLASYISISIPPILDTLSAVVLAFVLGTSLGLVAGQRTGGIADRTFSTGAYICNSMPSFWLGMMLILVFASKLGWLPTQGMYDMRLGATGFARVVDVARHMVLPVATLTLIQIPAYFRITKSSVCQVLTDDYITTFRITGMSEGKIFRKYVLKNAILPVVTVFGINLAYVVSGSTLVETVFSWPGIGIMMFNAISNRDYNVLMGVYIILAVSVAAVMILVDLVYAKLDPRIHYE